MNDAAPLSRQMIAAALAGLPGRRGVGREDGGPHDPARPGALRRAAVLLPLVERSDGLTLLLTLRTAHLRHHAGQVSLPGGRLESYDDGPAAAALRESFEEVGLAPNRVEVMGLLDDLETTSGFRITPVVGFIPPDIEIRPNAEEVAAVFEVPLSILFGPGGFRRGEIVHEGRVRSFFELYWGPYRIWGVTARILVDFARTLGVADAYPA